MLYLLAAYVGMNCYAYWAGDSEHRAWVVLGLLSSLLLMAIPFGAGVLAYWAVPFAQRKQEAAK
jgi:hypothetical protein